MINFFECFYICCFLPDNQCWVCYVESVESHLCCMVLALALLTMYHDFGSSLQLDGRNVLEFLHHRTEGHYRSRFSFRFSFLP